MGRVWRQKEAGPALFPDKKNNSRILLFMVGGKTQSVRARRDIRDHLLQPLKYLFKLRAVYIA